MESAHPALPVFISDHVGGALALVGGIRQRSWHAITLTYSDLVLDKRHVRSHFHPPPKKTAPRDPLGSPPPYDLHLF